MRVINWRKFAILSGYLFSAVMYFVLFLTFLVAYLNNYEVKVTINTYGEAHIEWFMMCFISGIIIIGFWYMLKELK